MTTVIPSLLQVAILLCACSLFLIRGPLRALRGRGEDFAAPYISALRFERGQDPYSNVDFLVQWHARGAAAHALLDESGQRPVYPPSTLILIAPLALMSWQHALAAYVLLCVYLFSYLLIRLAKLTSDQWNSWPRIGLLIYGLLLAPIHSGIALGNISALATVLCLHSLISLYKRMDSSAGILLAIAICLKPTICPLLLLYFVFSKRWKVLFIGFALSAGINACALLRMSQLDSAWKSNYRENVSFLFGPTGAANFASTDSNRFDQVNLQVPFFELTHNAHLSNILAWSLVGTLSVLTLLFLLRNNNLRCRWEVICLFLLLGLLPIYQRNYNSALVLAVFFWAFQNYYLRSAKHILVIGAFFLIPGEAIMRYITSHFHITWINPFTLNVVLMPQATWCLLIIIAILLSVISASPTEQIELKTTFRHIDDEQLR